MITSQEPISKLSQSATLGNLINFFQNSFVKVGKIWQNAQYDSLKDYNKKITVNFHMSFIYIHIYIYHVVLLARIFLILSCHSSLLSII